MSGYKRATVSISQDEYNRLRDAENQLRSIPPIAPEVVEDITRRSLAAFQTNFDRIQQRQRAFETMISGMDRIIHDMEKSTNQALVEMEQDILRETQAYVGSLWNYFDQALANHVAYFEEQIAATHRQFQEEQSQQARQIRRMESDMQRKQEIAEMWLDAAAQFCDFIKANYDYQQFVPGQVEFLQSRLNQAMENYHAGLSEAVIVTSQQLYSEFSDLRIQLERWHNEWGILYQSVWETVNMMICGAEAVRFIPATDLEGNDLPADIDVNYWTGGRLDELLRDLGYIRERLEDPDTQLSYDVLERWINIDMPGYDQALSDIARDARIAALNSQLRINIADLVIQALQDQGFALEDSDYEAEDMRESFNARLSNLEGNEVIVNVVPVGREIGQNELHLQSHDREARTEHELQQRWMEVDRSLASYGLEVSGYSRVEAATTRGGTGGIGAAARLPARERSRQKTGTG